MTSNSVLQKEVRIANVNLPINKHTWIALTYVKGIGKATSMKICEMLNIKKEVPLSHLSTEIINKLRDVIRDNYQVEGELVANVKAKIQHKKDIGCYQGFMHRRGLTVRGQRTRSNARTKRKRNY